MEGAVVRIEEDQRKAKGALMDGVMILVGAITMALMWAFAKGLERL
jgi:hypothetical protein